MKSQILAATFAAVLSMPTWANTWDEPWQETVAARATSFGLFKVEKVKGTTATAVLTRHLAGEPTPSAVDIGGYSQLNVTSASSDHWELWLKPGKSYYLYLVKGEKGSWQLLTPSAGTDLLRDNGLVEASYRISMHKALLPVPIYEMTQACIFQRLHAQACNVEPVQRFIDQQLAGEPANPDAAKDQAELDRFFMQHAAMETAAALQYAPAGMDLGKYIGTPAMHVQFSALKLLAATQKESAPQQLATFFCAGKAEPMSRAYALLLLQTQRMVSAAPTLQACLQTLPGDGQYALTPVMDPRIGTRFPYNLKSSAEKLLAEWQAN
ncbi:hypothetical protein ACS5PN_10620 [Roseateles sp. NT4]|uniref:hypothetical protein n=1 Tax=Roseateles sp. NT4 TaxID=3453715 RepID=UPI003EEBB45A